METTAHADLNKAMDEAAAPPVTLDQLVTLCIEKEASDIHFGENSRAALRVSGKISFVENIAPLSHETMVAIVEAMLSGEDEKKRLERVREIDLSYTHKSGVSFRVNVFYQRGKLSVVMRMISKHVPALNELGIPDVVKNLLSLRQGLILVTGNTGSGKSTTIQAMLQYINQNFVEHIITIENPIEHIFTDQKSVFTQREIGKDTLTLSNALQSAIRQDPNVIMVSEVGDAEAFDRVLDVVETGHLVIAAMLHKNATQTLERVASLFPQNHQEQIQNRLADNLIAILSQTLVDRADQAGRVAVCELLVNTHQMPNLIRRGNFRQVYGAIQAGAQDGMITMAQFAAHLARNGAVSSETAAQFTEQD